MLAPPIVLADAAGVLSGQFRLHVRRLAELIEPVAGDLDRRFTRQLSRNGCGRDETRTLSGITIGAACRELASSRSAAPFLESLDASGRRLANLNVPPAHITGALGEYDLLLERHLAGSVPPATPEALNLRWARNQLHFCITIGLNHAFYQVREAEARAFYDMFHAELKSQGPEELLEAFLNILKDFFHAGAGRMFPAEAIAPALRRRLAKPLWISAGAAERLVLDSRMRVKCGCVWSVPLSGRGRVAGVFQLGFRESRKWLIRELELLTAGAERCALAAEKARLLDDLARREEQIRRLASHVLRVEEEERRRISRELHDETGQSMLCLRLQLEMLERAVPPQAGEMLPKVREARQLTEGAILEIRRIISALSPAVLEQLGLAAALRQSAARFRRSHPIRVRLRLPRRNSRLPKDCEVVIYRLVQEACHNIAKHSRASTVNISLRSTDGSVRLRVEDDGVGFDAQSALDQSAAGSSFGLAGMRERVGLLGGSFQIESSPNRGTKISVEIPLGNSHRGTEAHGEDSHLVNG